MVPPAKYINFTGMYFTITVFRQAITWTRRELVIKHPYWNKSSLTFSNEQFLRIFSFFLFTTLTPFLYLSQVQFHSLSSNISIMSFFKSKYHLLPESESDSASFPNQSPPRSSRSRQAFQILTCLLLASIGFIAGTLVERTRTSSSCIQGISSITKSNDTVPIGMRILYRHYTKNSVC